MANTKKKPEVVFIPPVGEEIRGIVYYHDRIFVACTFGVWELYEDYIDPSLVCNRLISKEGE